MDSRQAILPVALRVNANLFQTDLCRDPVAMDGIRNICNIDEYILSTLDSGANLSGTDLHLPAGRQAG